MIHQTLKAAERLANEEVSVEAIDLHTLHPLDKETILNSVHRTSKAIIVHEDNSTGSLGGEIAAIIAQWAFERLEGPIMHMARPDVPGVPFRRPLERFVMRDAIRITQASRAWAAY
jgi:2-oxoisovalerate dehydrogenase E1 component beta subunit